MNKVLLVGCGHMGSALLSAWVNLEKFSFSVIDPLNYKHLKRVYSNKKVKIFNKLPSKFQMKNYDIIIFAIKPQVSKKVVNEYRNFEFKKNSLIATIVAGKKISFFNNNIKNAVQIVRIMPNMPALISCGVSCFVANKKLSQSNKKKINDLFLQVGKTIWLKNEKQIDKATAISGSGPGYIFTLIDSLEKASQKIGFSKKISREIILSTLLGSAKLMKTSNKEPGDLANSIAVKGGTTEAGIKALKKYNPTKIMYDTFLAAYKKANMLGKNK